MNEVIGWGPDQIGLMPLAEEEQTPELSLSLSAMGGHRKKVAFCKPGRETSPEALHAGTGSVDESPELGENNFCCLSHPVDCILLWQPEQNNTSSLREINAGYIRCADKGAKLKESGSE